jgi:hypothetical protein
MSLRKKPKTRLPASVVTSPNLQQFVYEPQVKKGRRRITDFDQYSLQSRKQKFSDAMKKLPFLSAYKRALLRKILIVKKSLEAGKTMKIALRLGVPLRSVYLLFQGLFTRESLKQASKQNVIDFLKESHAKFVQQAGKVKGIVIKMDWIIEKYELEHIAFYVVQADGRNVSKKAQKPHSSSVVFGFRVGSEFFPFAILWCKERQKDLRQLIPASTINQELISLFSRRVGGVVCSTDLKILRLLRDVAADACPFCACLQADLLKAPQNNISGGDATNADVWKKMPISFCLLHAYIRLFPQVWNYVIRVFCWKRSAEIKKKIVAQLSKVSPSLITDEGRLDMKNVEGMARAKILKMLPETILEVRLSYPPVENRKSIILILRNFLNDLVFLFNAVSKPGSDRCAIRIRAQSVLPMYDQLKTLLGVKRSQGIYYFHVMVFHAPVLYEKYGDLRVFSTDRCENQHHPDKQVFERATFKGDVANILSRTMAASYFARNALRDPTQRVR